ncbi:MAG TPA: hypothetical protein VK211_25095 [Kamptonema sp.]|jgi:hypothetical protein|nr:hypothetical protein [Kamptonema sp.]
MHGQFDREPNFHIREPHAHQIHQTDFNSAGDDDNFLFNLLAEGVVNIFKLFS